MDKKYIILLAVIVLLCLAAALAYVLSGERLAKRIARENVSSVTVTYRRKAYTFTEDADIDRLCAAVGSVKLRRFAAKGSSQGSKIGDNFFVTFSYRDGTALDLCFNGDFTVCRIGAAEYRRVQNPETAKRLAAESNFEKED